MRKDAVRAGKDGCCVLSVKMGCFYPCPLEPDDVAQMGLNLRWLSDAARCSWLYM